MTDLSIAERITALGLPDEPDAGVRYLMGIVTLHVLYAESREKADEEIAPVLVELCELVQRGTRQAGNV